MKDVSVIIPIYNNEKSIKKALDSVKNQTSLNRVKEVILINDGSTDGSLSIIEGYKKENKNINIVIINKKNEGPSIARNEGLKIAKGYYIALLDSDDEWLEQKLEKQLEIFDNNADVDFLGCNSSEKDLFILFKKIEKLHKVNIKEICLKCFPSTPAAMFKKKIFDEIGGFNELQKYGEDMNYFNKICINYNYYHLPEFLVKIGGGKPQFGHSGLSKNLKEMHWGNLNNIKELRVKRAIKQYFYYFLYLFYWLKHFRRILITKFRRK